MPWKPGESGNPNGRPKKGGTVREILRSLLDEDDKKAIAKKLQQMALDGDVRAMALFFDQHDGKLPQPLTGGEDDDGNDKPIPLRIVQAE